MTASALTTHKQSHVQRMANAYRQVRASGGRFFVSFLCSLFSVLCTLFSVLCSLFSAVCSS